MNKQKNVVKTKSSIHIYIDIEFKAFLFPSRRLELFRRVIDSYIINIFDEETPNRANVVVAVELVVVYEQKLRNRI